MNLQRSGLRADFFRLLLTVMVVIGMIGPVFGAESASPLSEARLLVGVAYARLVKLDVATASFEEVEAAVRFSGSRLLKVSAPALDSHDRQMLAETIALLKAMRFSIVQRNRAEAVAQLDKAMSSLKTLWKATLEFPLH